jgi:hypothetical protein
VFSTLGRQIDKLTSIHDQHVYFIMLFVLFLSSPSQIRETERQIVDTVHCVQVLYIKALRVFHASLTLNRSDHFEIVSE